MRAMRDFETHWPPDVTVDVTAAICQEAGDLVERYQLRRFDFALLTAEGQQFFRR